MFPVRYPLVIALLVLAVAANVLGQSQDPKRRFTDGLGSTTAALEGRFGDDGSRVAAGLVALEKALADWDGALAQDRTAVKTALSTAPPAASVRVHVAMALTLAERGLVDDALKEIGAATAASAADVDAQTVLGLIHSQLTGDAAAATNAFRAAVAADPAAPLQRYLLVKQLADAGAVEEAAAVGLPLRTDTRTADAPDRAPFLRIHAIPEVPGVEPYFPLGRYLEPFALIARGQYTAGLASLKAAAAGDPLLAAPQEAKADLAAAGAALRDGDPAAALAALDRAGRIAPAWSEVHRLRGVALAADDRVDQAVAAFREALRLAPTDERSHLALADALAAHERYDAAAGALRDAITALPRAPRLHHALGRILQRQDIYPEALVEFERSLTLEPAVPLLGRNSVYRTIATLRRAQQEFPEATRAFATRVNLVPNDVGAHRDLGDIYFRQGLDDLAWNEFAMAEALAPRDPETQFSLAQLHLRAGRSAAAAEAARRIIRIDPSHVQAHFVLGTALVRMDRVEEGTRELDTFAQLDAADAQVRTLQLEVAGLRREADVSAARGDHARAVSLLRDVVARMPQSADARAALGVALLSDGRASDAVAELTAAARLDPSGDAYRHLADAYERLGQTEQSAQARAAYARIKRQILREAAHQ